MVGIAEKDNRRDLVNSLWNTYNCQNKVYIHDGRLYSKYCKNRFCTTCLGIRKAEMINSYYPVLKEWKDAQLVTLTIKSVYKNELNKLMRKCLQGLSLILDRCDKRHQRGKGIKVMGIRSLECNFNPEKGWYNPHIHLIVPDYETAMLLKIEWQKQWKRRPTKRNWVNHKGQDITKINTLDNALIEVIKYGTKVFTDPTENKKKGRRTGIVYARAFYNIIVAMQGLRLFGSFGFILPKETKKEKTPAKVVADCPQWQYMPELQNWLNTNSWETLFDHMPNAELEELLGWCIDKERD